jgi:uncharacterized protein (DUF1330 family)
MPLLRFDLIKGRDEKSVTKLLNAAHDAVVKALGVPARDRYQIVHQHPAHELIVQDTGLGIERSRNVVLITITSIDRSNELKQALYRALSEELERQCGIAPNDVMISLVTNTGSDWSFGFGEAQFLTGKPADSALSLLEGRRVNFPRRTNMAKGYWITFYRSISDPTALTAYAKLAGPAIAANGGRFLARGDAVKAYEQGIAQSTTVTEFDSVEQAIAAHDSPAYREALRVLGNACERDVRIVGGLG